jgi:hypothetical protein
MFGLPEVSSGYDREGDAARRGEYSGFQNYLLIL